MTEYDYKTQRWVTGNEAKALRIEHVREELSILLSDQAEEYLRLCGEGREVAVAISEARSELASLVR